MFTEHGIWGFRVLVMVEDVGQAVGRRIRRRRRLMGLSQQALGSACGLSFQQVQKYESATCRVPATVLWRLSQALGVDMNYFFEGLGVATQEPAPVSAERPYLRLAV